METADRPTPLAGVAGPPEEELQHHFERARARAQAGLREEAAAELRRIVELCPAGADAAYRARLELIGLGVWRDPDDEVAAAYETLLKENAAHGSRRAEVLLKLAQFQFWRGKYAESAELYRRILNEYGGADDPWPAFQARLNLINIERNSGDAAASIPKYISLIGAVTLSDMKAMVRLEAARALRATGDAAAASERFRELAEGGAAWPDVAREAREELAREARERERAADEDARRKIESALARGGEAAVEALKDLAGEFRERPRQEAGVRVATGRAHLLRERRDEAAAEFRRAVELLPEPEADVHFQARFELLQLAKAAGAAASAAYEELLSECGARPDRKALVLEDRGEFHCLRGEFERAAESFRSVADIKEAAPTVLFKSRMILLNIERRGGPAGAIAKYDALLREAPEPEMAALCRLERARALDGAERASEAESEFRALAGAAWPYIAAQAREEAFRADYRRDCAADVASIERQLASATSIHRGDEEIVADLDRLLSEFGDKPVLEACVRSERAAKLRRMGRLDEAKAESMRVIGLYRGIAERYGGSAAQWPLFKAKLNLVNLRRDSGEAAASLPEYDALISSAPDDEMSALGRLDRARAMLDAGQPAESAREFEDLAGVSWKSIADESRAEILRANYRRDCAGEVAALTRRLEMAVVPGRRGADVVSELTDLLNAHRGRPVQEACIRAELGVALRRLRRFDEAVAESNRVAELHREISDRYGDAGGPWPLFKARLNLANVRRDSGKAEEALSDYDELLASSADLKMKALAGLDRLRALRACGRRAEAENGFHEVAAQCAAWPEVAAQAAEEVEIERRERIRLADESLGREILVAESSVTREVIVAAFDRLLERSAGSPRAAARIHCALGQALARLNRFAEAEAEFEKAAGGFDTDCDTETRLRARLGRICVGRGGAAEKIAEAEALLKECVAGSAARIDVLDALGQLHYDMKNFAEAARIYQSIVAGRAGETGWPFFKARLNLLNMERLTGGAAAAIAKYDALVRTLDHPEMALAARVERARAVRAAGRGGEAERELAEILGACGRWPYIAALVQDELDQERREKAGLAAARLEEEIASAQAAAADDEQCLASLAPLLERFRANAEAEARLRREIGQILVRLDRMEEAEREYRRAIELGPDPESETCYRARIGLVNVRMRGGRDGTVLAACEDLLRDYGGSPERRAEILQNIGEYHYCSGNAAEARRFFVMILEGASGLTSRWPAFKARLNLLNIERDGGQAGAVIAKYDALGGETDHPEMRALVSLEKCRAVRAVGRRAEANDGFAGIAAESRRWPYIASQASLELVREKYEEERLAQEEIKRLVGTGNLPGREQETVDALRGLLARFRDRPAWEARVRSELGQLLLRMDRLKDAEENFRAVLGPPAMDASEDTLFDCRLQLAVLQRRKGRAVEETLEDLRGLLRDAAASPEKASAVRLKIAQIGMAAGLHDEAERELEALLSDGKAGLDEWTRFELLLSRAQVTLWKGQPVEPDAIRALVEHADKVPAKSRPDAYWNLGNLLSGHNDIAAERIFRRAEQLFSSDPNTRFRMRLQAAASLAKQGNRLKALAIYEELERDGIADPGDRAEVNYHIARMRFQLGQFDEAEKHYAIAVETHPHHGSPFYFQARIELINSRMKREPVEKTVAAFNGLLEECKGSDEARGTVLQNLAQFHYNKDNLPEAKRIFESILSDPYCAGSPSVLFKTRLTLLNIERDSGQPEAAVAKYGELLKEAFDPELKAMIHLEAGRAMRMAGYRSEAELRFEHVAGAATQWPDILFAAHKNLVAVKREQGKLAEARKVFQSVRPLYRGSPNKLMELDLDNQVRLDWCIHLSCNYRCSYCFFNKTWVELANRNVYKTVPEWMAIWERMNRLYGQIYLVINGGEPFTYPNFVDLVYNVQLLHGPINIATNVSQFEAIEELVTRVNKNLVNAISITFSFHPQFEDIDRFVEKVRHLKSVGADVGALNVVAYPPFLHRLPEYVDKFAAIGESMRIHPFIGAIKGKNYPDGYNREERALMKLPDDWVESKRPMGRLCYAGQSAGLIHPDGAVTRCGQAEWGHSPFGNIFDPEFRLMDEPKGCHAASCPCDKWIVIPKVQKPQPGQVWFM